MSQTHPHHPSTWLLVAFIKVTTFLITTGFVFVSYIWESRHDKKSKLENPHV